MKINKFLIFSLVISLFLVFAVGCSSSEDTSNPVDEDVVKVVASTSWTGVIAEAAGATNVTVLAPVELRHPPEYDFKPSDVQALIEADWIIMAGYEAFMNQMIEANNIDEAKIIRVTTTNTYDVLVEQTRAAAEKMGTQEAQGQWELEFTDVMDTILERAQENDVENIKVLVHMHMQGFVRSLGFDVLEVFSADELSPARIGELASMNPDLIIDNFHNPQGVTIAETIDAERVELRNFPGPDHKTIIDLLIANATLLGVY